MNDFQTFLVRPRTPTIEVTPLRVSVPSFPLTIRSNGRGIIVLHEFVCNSFLYGMQRSFPIGVAFLRGVYVSSLRNQVFLQQFRFL